MYFYATEKNILEIFMIANGNYVNIAFVTV